MIKIDSDLIIVGNGESYRDGSIVIENGKISYAGEAEHAPELENTIQCPVTMPGMWDTHVHFTGIRKPDLQQLPFTTPYEAALRCVWDVNEVLQAGFTSVREVGGWGVYLNRIIQEKLINGPRIYGSGKVISTTGGHGDIHGLNLGIVNLINQYNLPFVGELADGVAGCLQAVRKQLRAGAEVIKYCASGGVMSELDHPIHQQFSIAEQRAIVEEATRAERAVAAHCHGAPGIRSALEAGVATIEHGTYLDENLADKMLENDAILIPTRYAVQKLMDGAEKMGVPSYAMDKLRALNDQHQNAIKIAIKKGVPIALGTDIFTSGPGGIFQWGENAMELVYLTELGMSNKEAIMSATSRGPQTLGPQAPRSGQLKNGYDADILLMEKNPLEDISHLTKKENIIKVMKSGNFVSN